PSFGHQVLVPVSCKPAVIMVWLHVQMRQKRRGQQQFPAWLEQPPKLRQDRHRIGDVLEYFRANNRVQRLVSQWNSSDVTDIIDRLQILHEGPAILTEILSLVIA